jgi:hypothetical protein
MNTDKSVRTPEEIAMSISIADQIAHVEFCAEEARHVGYAERAMELAVLRTLNAAPALVEALEAVKARTDKIYTMGHEEARRAAVDCYEIARAALSLAGVSRG